jgi:hypothetical protein
MTHRFAPKAQPDVWRFFQTPRRKPSPQAFVVCPVVLIQGQPFDQGAWLQEIYALAYERAQAELGAAEPRQDFHFAWN